MSGFNSKKRRVVDNKTPNFKNDNQPHYRGQDLTSMAATLAGQQDPFANLGNNGLMDIPTTQGSGGARTGGKSPAPTPQNTYGETTWLQLLSQAGASGGDFTSLLSSLGFGRNEGHIATEIAQDIDKQLFTQILAQLVEQDKRKYNEGMLADQRLYDSPTNQLARLMGAGISRDAAIQMLSGGGSGGSGVVTGDAAALADGPSASESLLNQSQRATGIANTVFSGISSLVGLTSLGFSIPQAIQSIKGMTMQNQLTGGMLQGLQAADSLLGAAGNAVQAGLMTKEEFDDFDNGTDYLNHIAANKDKSGFAELYASPAFQRVYGTVQGREMFNRGWSAVIKGKTEGQQVRNFIELQDVQKRVGMMSAEKMGAEMNNLAKQGELFDAQTNLTLQKVCESEAVVQFMNAQGKLVEVNTKKAKLEYELTDAGFPKLKQKYLDTLDIETQELAALMNNPTALKNHIDAFVLENGENAQLVQYLMSVDNGAMAGFAESCPTIYSAIKIMQRCGVFDRFVNAALDYDSPVLTPKEKFGIVGDLLK